MDIALDEYGTYFRTISLDKVDLLYSNPVKNSYTLKITFENNDINYTYQSVIESVKIIINSKQII